MSRPLEIWHPFTQAALDPSPVKITGGEGVYLFTEDGRRLIDGISSWWVNIHGHAHAHIARAIARQARQLEHVIFAGFTHEPAERLAVKLRAVTPNGLEHVFFSDNGSTAVEVALKMAVQYWKNRGAERKTTVVALDHAYHGDTVGAMSVSADSVFTSSFDSMRFKVRRSHSAYCYRCPVGLQRRNCSIECVESMEALLGRHAGEIAAVIVEPLLQGAGGMIIHPTEFLESIGRLCKQHDVLLIADEVLTGFGRTGAMFASELAGVSPDIMCVSKGLTGGFLPFAATLCSDTVHSAFVASDRMQTFFHGHSYAGNPIGCAAAVANLEIFESEPVFDRIRRIEGIHRDRLARLADNTKIGDTRMLGTVAVLELTTEDPGYLSDLRPIFCDFFVERGVLLRPLGNIIYILPPYVIQPDELHHVYDVVAEAIERLV